MNNYINIVYNSLTSSFWTLHTFFYMISSSNQTVRDTDYFCIYINSYREHLPAVDPMYCCHNKSQCNWSCLVDQPNLTKSFNFPENVLYILFFFGVKCHGNGLFFNIFMLLFQSSQKKEEKRAVQIIAQTGSWNGWLQKFTGLELQIGQEFCEILSS